MLMQWQRLHSLDLLVFSVSAALLLLASHTHLMMSANHF
jgi:hypothetical protein